MLIKYGIGTDISGDSFHACISVVDSHQRVKVKGTRKFSNTPVGFRDFWQWCCKHIKEPNIPVLFCMEASGVYHEALAYFVSEKGQNISILLPNKAKKYIESLGIKTKNDKADSKALSQMACERNLKLWQPAAGFYLLLREMTRQHQSCQETKTQIKNQLHASEVKQHASKLVVKQLKQTIKLLEKQVKQLEKQISDHISSNEKVKAKFDNICKIKGVATLTVSVIVAETLGFELFENSKQLVSYAGYDVVENQSGKRTGKTKISKKGNSRIRRILHLPAFSVVSNEQRPFYNIFHRTLEKHNIKMKSYVAVQRKILTTVYAIWKNDTPYDNNYRISIKKNSPEPVETTAGTTAYEYA